MNKSSSNPYTLLLPTVSQFEVDFVVPRLGVDIELGIDPFLLYKSRDKSFALLHKHLLTVFNTAISHLGSGDLTSTRYLFDFPEVSEVGLGYTKRGKRGSGLGDQRAELIIETLLGSPALLGRGVRHVEEMQLVSVGIGPDRISDITANILKQDLITYTQQQCELWNIPVTKGVPITHIFDINSFEWYDDYVDLPVSPIDALPIILVPRRIVRTLPWINYGDYFRMEFSAYLRHQSIRRAKLSRRKHIAKAEIVAISREEIERIERFIDRKEETSANAQPSLNYLDPEAKCPEAKRLGDQLAQLTPGTKDAARYQRLILEILNYLFSPELIDGQIEVRTVDGTERRDIIFVNDSDKTFWAYIRGEYSALPLMFETKNTEEVEISHINQTAAYLGDRLGYIGFIITRNRIDLARQRKIYSIYNDSNPRRKIILVLSDEDIYQMLDMKCNGRDPMEFVRTSYRHFRQTVQ